MYRAPPKFMRIVGLRELHRSTGEVVKRLEEGGEPFVITRRGRAVAVLFPCANNAPMQPAVSLEPPLPVPTGLQLAVFEEMNETEKMPDRVAKRLGAKSAEIAPACGQLEIRGYIHRGFLGYRLSKKGAALAEWMRQERASAEADLFQAE